MNEPEKYSSTIMRDTTAKVKRQKQLGLDVEKFVRRGAEKHPYFESFYRIIADSVDFAELSGEDRQKFLTLELQTVTVYLLVTGDSQNKQRVIEDHFAMVAADADVVRHSRLVDKRLDYERIVGPLLSDPPITELDFNEIRPTLPKFTMTAANALISSFGPGAVKMQEMLVAKSVEVKEEHQKIRQ